MDDVPAHAQNLRQNLLRSVGFSMEDEKHSIAKMKAVVDRRLRGEHEDSGNRTVFSQLLSPHARETLTVKSSISRWIRQELVVCPGPHQAFIERQSSKRHFSPQSLLHLCLDRAGIQTLIRILEEVDDYTTMAAVLMLCSTCCNTQILTLATVTVTHHLDIFFAIGTADQLFTQIFRQQATLEDQDGRSSLLEALIDLAKCMLNRSKEILVLQHDLQKYDSKPSVAACSPISDHMVRQLFKLLAPEASCIKELGETCWDTKPSLNPCPGVAS